MTRYLSLALLFSVLASPLAGQQTWLVSAHDRAQVFEAPPEYRLWYDELVEWCECEPTLTFEAIIFRRVPGIMSNRAH